MTSLRLALKQSLEESSGGFSPPSLGSDGNLHNNGNPPPSPNAHHRGIASPPASAVASAAVPLHNSSTEVATLSPQREPQQPGSQPWKKRGPGRPRKNPQEGGTAKKRGRPRKHPIEEHASSSENEFSGDGREEGEEEEHSAADGAADAEQKKSKKKSKPPQPEPTDETAKPKNNQGGSLASSHSGNAEPAPNKEPTKEATAVTRDKSEPDAPAEGGRGTMSTKAKTVPPPDQRILSWARNIPIKEARVKVTQGLRVKVRFSTRVKREGKFVRKKKWYGGLVSQVSKAGSKIRIKYDDGTTEVAKFPDKDIVVDEAFNGEHAAPADFFIPPDDMEEDAAVPRENDTVEDSLQPQPGPQPEERSDNGAAVQRLESVNLVSESTLIQPAGEPTEILAVDKSLPTQDTEVAMDKAATGGEPADRAAEGSVAAEATAESTNHDQLPKPKRKRGRPPKLRQSVPETPLQQQQLSEAALLSPVPSAAGAEMLAAEPDAAKRSQPDAGDGEGREVADGAVLDEDKLPSSRVLKAKPPDMPDDPGVQMEQAEESPNLHSRVTVQKGHDRERRDQVEPAPSGHSRDKGRTTPVPVASVAAPQKQANDLKTPSSPRSKKAKRKRIPDLSPATRSRSPKPPQQGGGEDVEKFQSAGSAFETKMQVDQLQNESEEEGGKTLTPRGRPNKHDASRSGRRAAAKEANDRMASKQDEQVSRKKKKRDRRREADGEESDREEDPQQAPWVQCDKCKKWRIIPSDVVGSLPDRWFCANNVWDPKRASCDAPQQKDKQHIRERKRRKRQRLLEKAAAAESRAAGDAPADVVSDGSVEREGSNASRSNEEAEEKQRRTSPTEHAHSDSSVNNDLAKSDKKGHPKKLRAHHAAEQVGIQAGIEMKPRGRGRPRRNLGKGSAPMANTEQNPDEAENLEWVQCERCDKWRKLPPHISADELPDVWYCAMNTWNPASASCSAPEDKAEAGLTDIFNNPAAGEGKLSYRSLIFGNGRRFNRPISERTRAAESLFAAVSDDTDAPPAVMYANSSAFISRSKMNQVEEPEGLSVFDLMSRSLLWEELRGIGNGNNGLCKFDHLTTQTKESLKDIILHSLGSRTVSGEELANEIQHRDWQNVPLGWSAARPHCTTSTVVMTMCELVKEGVLECIKDFASGGGTGNDDFVLVYRRAESHSQTTLRSMPTSLGENSESSTAARCMKFAKPWKSSEAMVE